MSSIKLGVSGFGTNTGWTNNNIYPRFVEDITGDGRADIVGFGAAGAYTSISNGDGTFQAWQLGIDAFGTAGGWTNNNIYPRFVEDITGDGRADIVGFGAAGAYTSISNGGGTFQAWQLGIDAFGTAGGWTNNNIYPRFVEDITGDGRADIVGFGAAGAYTSISNGDGTFQAWQLGIDAFGTAGGWTNNNIYPRFVEDITGDGRADIVGFGAAGAYTSISNGDGTFQAWQLGIDAFGTAGGWTNNNIYPRFVEDITGDGRADIVGFGAAGAYTSISNGDGTFQAWQLGIDAFGTAGGWTNNNIYPRFVEDITGDGRADIVGFGAAGAYTSISNGDGTFQAWQLGIDAFGTNTGWTNNNIYPRFVEDITGDSRADIIGFASDGVYDWVM